MKSYETLKPSANITRASHVVLTSNDLGKARDFYVGALGMVVSEETPSALYLRGLEERGHHSLVLKRDPGPPVCERIGLRVLTEDDLDEAMEHFARAGHPAAWAQVPHQGRTLHVSDTIGTPLELVATMEEAENLLQRFDRYRSASPQRIDHFQVVAQDVARAMEFYMPLGFRLTEYTAKDGTDEVWGAWLARKGNPHDIVFANGRGPRLHHFAFTVRETHELIHACDVASSLGQAGRLERGPGRHGIGNALFVYFRDPDGHRIELFTSHYQAIDIDVEPLRWELSDLRRAQLWGLPATAGWFFEASEFAGVAPSEPRLKADVITLERFLATQ
jgi:catechol 2,3-dioxygenase